MLASKNLVLSKQMIKSKKTRMKKIVSELKKSTNLKKTKAEISTKNKIILPLITTNINNNNSHQDNNLCRPPTPLSPTFQMNQTDYFDSTLSSSPLSNNSDLFNNSIKILTNNGLYGIQHSNETSNLNLTNRVTLGRPYSSSNSNKGTKRLKKQPKTVAAKKQKNTGNYLELNSCLSPSPSPPPSTTSSVTSNSIYSINPKRKNFLSSKTQENCVLNNFIELIKEENKIVDLNESLPIGSWCFTSNAVFRKNRLRFINKTNLRKISRSPFIEATKKFVDFKNQSSKNKANKNSRTSKKDTKFVKKSTKVSKKSSNSTSKILKIKKIPTKRSKSKNNNLNQLLKTKNNSNKNKIKNIMKNQIM